MNRLENILKQKGVGPKGSKNLSSNELQELSLIIDEEETSSITRATLITSFIMLENSEIEDEWINSYLDRATKFDDVRFFQNFNEEFVYKTIRDVVDYNDLNYHTTYKITEICMKREVPEWAFAIFLQAMRIKRETPEENRAFWDVLEKFSTITESKLPIVLDLSNSYDGYNRNQVYTVFIAPFFAELGIPTVVHDLFELSPKFGITSHKILRESGKDYLFSGSECVDKLEDKNIGWCFIDRSIYNPVLNSFNDFRKEMVKRPFISTFEKLLLPIKGENTHIVTGYTHNPYKIKLADLMLQKKEVTSAIIMKGLEGSTQLSIINPTDYVVVNSNIEEKVHIPEFLDTIILNENSEISASACFEEGLKAISGVKNSAREQILVFVLFVLENLSLSTNKYSKLELEMILDSGVVKERFERFFQ